MGSRFTFHRGSLALDFAGTLGRRASTREERLPDAAALTTWLREAHLVGDDVPASANDFASALALREAIARAGTALADGTAPDVADVVAINDAARWTSLARPALDPGTLAVRWEGAKPIRAAVGRIAADAIDVFANRRERIVRCELPGCGALLLSHSRGPMRRWCSMETCGNIAKAAAHRTRAKAISNLQVAAGLALVAQRGGQRSTDKRVSQIGSSNSDTLQSKFKRSEP